MLELSNAYAPTNVTVTTSSGVVLAADTGLRTLELTNIGGFDVWLCAAGQTAEVDKGFYLPAHTTKTFDQSSIPLNGLNGIANGGQAIVAIGRG